MSEDKSCKTCGNRCMDMEMDPYCAVKAVREKYGIFGRTLRYGPVDVCLVDGELTLWEEDTRSPR